MRNKQIIVCLDGTWDDLDERSDTNVARLVDLVAGSSRTTLEQPGDDARETYKYPLPPSSFWIYDGAPVVVYYGRGVGTGTQVDRLFGGAFGIGLDDNIRAAYRFLSRHYNFGDDVFVFGFSRGAYTARSLVGYISSVGLLRPECSTPEIEGASWKLYRTAPNARSAGVWQDLQKYMFDRDRCAIACLGAFDTVGALGIPVASFRRSNRIRYQFHDVGISPICAVKVGLREDGV